MPDLDAVTGFEWDEGNRRKSGVKHGVTQAEAEQVFLNEPLLVIEDRVHSIDEDRYHALGVTDGKRKLHVTFALRRGGTLIRIISARGMTRKEKLRYEEEA